MPTGIGVTSDTPANLTIGAGILIRDHAVFGATTGDNLFAVERTMFIPQLNGLLGDLKGTDYIQRSVGRIEASIPEVGAQVVGYGIPDAHVDVSTPGVTVVTDATARRISDAAYADWELDVDRANGGQFQFEVYNAINTGNFEGNLQDTGMFAPRYVLAGRLDAGSLSSPAWKIRIQDVAS